MSYRGVRVMVLGASGFLGRWLARLLEEEGAELIVTARDLAALAPIQAEYGFGGEARQLDALDVAALVTLLEETSPAIVFNAIGYGVDRSERDESLARRINTDFVETLARRLEPPQRLIHAGSALEYGAIGGDLDEASTPNPTTLYGRSKLEGTERLRTAAVQVGLQALTARLFTIYGPGEHEGRLLPSLLAARGSTGPLDFTAGTQRRDFTYVEDAARCLLMLGICDAVRPGEIVNVATGRLTSVRAFIETAIEVLRIPSERVRLGAIPTRSEEMSHEQVAIARLRALIGCAPESTPEEGIRRAARFGPPAESVGLGRCPPEGPRATPFDAVAHHQRSTCRGCDGVRLRRFLELGEQPLANAFLKDAAARTDERKYPLDVYFCEDCKLVQLVDVIDPAVLFRDYIYVTGTSETIALHNEAYAKSVVEALGLGPEDLVVEVASNDGSLLSRFKALGVRTLGIEPATNIAKLAEAAGIETINDFFDRACGERVRSSRGAAKAVIGNNVLAHVDDPVGFLAGAAALIADDGRVIVEFPYLEELLDRLEYDTIYHEHLCYFSLTAVANIFARAGLSVLRADRVPVHGGSLRVFGGKRSLHPEHAPAVEDELDREARAGMTDFARFERFAELVEANKRELLALLERLQSEGRSLAAYGAPAKGNTLLNYCGIGTELIPYTVDRSPLKVGRLTPGMHIPVLPAAELEQRRPDYTLILAWNFAGEIMRQQEGYRAKGGRFIIPIPEPRIA